MSDLSSRRGSYQAEHGPTRSSGSVHVRPCSSVFPPPPLLNPPRLRHNPAAMKTTTNAPLSYTETEIRSYLPTGWDLLGDPAGTWDPKKQVWRSRGRDGVDFDWPLEAGAGHAC